MGQTAPPTAQIYCTNNTRARFIVYATLYVTLDTTTTPTLLPRFQKRTVWIVINTCCMRFQRLSKPKCYKINAPGKPMKIKSATPSCKYAKIVKIERGTRTLLALQVLLKRCKSGVKMFRKRNYEPGMEKPVQIHSHIWSYERKRVFLRWKKSVILWRNLLNFLLKRAQMSTGKYHVFWVQKMKQGTSEFGSEGIISIGWKCGKHRCRMLLLKRCKNEAITQRGEKLFKHVKKTWKSRGFENFRRKIWRFLVEGMK